MSISTNIANFAGKVNSSGQTPLDAAGSAQAVSGILPPANGGTGSSSLSTITVGSANNLTGGVAGDVPTQTAAGTTGFITKPATDGTYAVQFVKSGTTYTVSYALVSGFTVNTATNVAGGTAGQLVQQTAPGATGFVNANTLAVASAGTATNLAGGAALRIPYQTAAGTTSFLPAPTVASTAPIFDGTNIVWGQAGGGGTTIPFALAGTIG